jgi:hypothetical protein
MILDRLELDAEELARLGGWRVTPEGACRGDRCVPLSGAPDGSRIDVRALADRLGMPVVRDERHGLWAIGPEAGGRALASARMPELVLPDLEGAPFDLASLRGTKVLLVAWASW